MDFVKYFSKGKYGFPKPGLVGVESDWLQFGELDVPRGRLWLGDAAVTARDEGVSTKVKPGRYVVELKGMDFKGVRVVSRARVIPGMDRSFAVGARLGEAITDSAMIAICDIDALEAAVTKEHIDEYERDVREGMSPPGTVISTFAYGERSFDVAWIMSGLGDGGYDVFALKTSGKTVGVEVEFLPPGYRVQ